LLLAILLWDEIYFWDNGRTTWWKEDARIMNKLPFLTGLVLPQDVEFSVNNIRETDVIASSAQQYLLIAERCGLDYLPKRERYEELASKKYYSNDDHKNVKNIVWQKFCIEKVEESVQKYYNNLVKMMGDIQLRFQFPLLLDYIRSEAEDSDYITAALHMRHTGPLCNMRLWIENLHKHIDAGNWAEVEYSIKNVKDIVSKINSPSVKKDVKVQLKIPPEVCVEFHPEVCVNFHLGRLLDGQRTQLTFLRDLTQFAILRRPGSLTS